MMHQGTPVLIFIVICLLLLLYRCAFGFNVDLKSRLVHRGEARSMFGYDVDMYQSRSGVVSLLVGAPKAQTGQMRVRNGGAVYRCSTEDLRCTQILFDTTDHNWALNGSVSLQIDSKSEQWFGATVVSSRVDDTVIACAPRYTYFYSTFDRKEPVGTCFVAKDAFTSFREFSPCRKENRWGYHRLGFCMAGFSAAIAEEEEKLFIGAPGAWYWQGALIVQDIEREGAVRRTSEGPAYMDDTYMGYAMAAGHFKEQSINDVAVGVPKGNNLKGMVVLFDNEMSVLLNISGHQVGSYFGSAIAVADLNGDGLDDVVIGAPLESHKENEHDDSNPTKVLYEVGKVYIYFQNKMHFFQDFVSLRGDRVWSRFGHDVASVGDLNGDDYNDVIVGAPYDGPNQKGAVHIFHGAKTGIKEKAAQVIYAEDLDRALTTFGFSVSGGRDVDDNEYPDIFVGAYRSDRAVLLKTRPVVSVRGSVKMNPDTIDLENKLCRLSSGNDVPCAQMKLCVSYTGKGVADDLDFHFVIHLDAKKGNSSRARFLESSSVYKMTLESVPLKKGEQWCERRYIYLIDKIRDKLSPIIVQVSYSISHDTSGTALTPVKDAYLPEALTGEIQIQKDCGKDSICIPDLRLNTSLSKESVYIGADDRFNLSVAVHNALEDAFEAQFFLEAPIGLDYEGFSRDVSTRPISCSSPKEVDDKTYILVCDIGNPLPKNSTVRFNMQFSTQNFLSSTGGISLKLITNSTNNESFTTFEDNEQIIEIPLEVKADFIVTGVSKNESYGYQPSDFVEPQIFDNDVGPTVTHVYEVRNLGPTSFSEASLDIYWPSYFKDSEKPLLYLVSDIVTEGKITCELVQKGHINAEGLILRKNHEYENDRSKRSANVVEISPYGSAVAALRQAINAMKQGVKDFGSLFGGTKGFIRSVDLDCSKMTCTQWRCRLLDFKKNDRVLLTIESRLWVKTLVNEAFYDASISSIAVAQVQRLPYKHPEIDLPMRYAIVSTLVSPKDPGKISRGVPYWMIFVAALAGLTVLILLILLLWKLGFFKRKRPPRGQALLSKPPEAEHYGYSSYSAPAQGYTTYSNPQYRQKLL